MALLPEGLRTVPVGGVDSGTVEEGREEASVPADGAQGQRYPVKRREQEDG